ncbi:FAD-dependent oxidoreductase [Microbacterium sp. NIBRBAC000506063]|uniref:FAD-dependent oxidoreductase n=1 Tax=Microbacterium sp. NIBRBAC000506063 TaxID=2734618 RepID=UPI001BB5A6B5|nr:FAD-dependent oxidoreductase [Microbacterium sp. NIBRBAC000506063]QTV80076.1 FAD-dependent oxidoreductase [Microbacterium sp. NIBRBAC000506063]
MRFAQSAYRDWAELEEVSGEKLTTITGGVIFLPVDGPYSAESFTTSLDACDVPYELLSPAEVTARWPQFSVPDGVETVYTPDSGIAHAARTVATLQMQARAHGADIRSNTPVERLTPDGDGVIVHTAHGPVRAGKVILATDAWSNTLLEPLGAAIPLDVMQEQVTYFHPEDAADYDPTRFPVWIWEDVQCYYGFPSYGEPTIKAAHDVANNRMTPEERTYLASDEIRAELADFVHRLIPGSGRDVRTVTCQYALTPERRFVLSPLEEHPNIIVGLGAGHAFKFTPAIGRVLAELAIDGESTDDVSEFHVSRLTQPTAV